MLYCPECQSRYEEGISVCPEHDTRLLRLEVDPGDDPLVGVELDERFRLNELIGRGGMGRVYAATQLSVGRDVAVKILRRDLDDPGVALERFFREAKLVAELTHPNIVRLFDFGEDADRHLLYLVMEMVRGPALGDLLDRGCVEVDLACEIALQVCGALTEPHDKGLVHRDLKPDNLLLVPVSDGSLQVKVLDFGIARALDGNTRLTETGMVCGTPAYMSPEQARSEEVDPRSDLYSLGIILYELLAGRPPFEGDSSLELMLHHLETVPPDIVEGLDASDPARRFAPLVADLLQKAPSDRPGSAAEVRSRLLDIRRELDLQPVVLEGTEDFESHLETRLLPRAELPDSRPPPSLADVDPRAATDLVERAEASTDTGDVGTVAPTPEETSGIRPVVPQDLDGDLDGDLDDDLSPDFSESTSALKKLFVVLSLAVVLAVGTTVMLLDKPADSSDEQREPSDEPVADRREETPAVETPSREPPNEESPTEGAADDPAPAKAGPSENPGTGAAFPEESDETPTAVDPADDNETEARETPQAAPTEEQIPEPEPAVPEEKPDETPERTPETAPRAPAPAEETDSDGQKDLPKEHTAEAAEEADDSAGDRLKELFNDGKLRESE